MSSTIVVTGSAGGMTSLAIRQLVASLPSSTHFILLVRNPSTVSEGVLPPSSVNVELVALDLADLSSCQTIGSEIASRVQSGGLPPISALVESAAMQDVRGPSPKLTEDSYETTFAINYLSHFILTQALLPAMDRKEGRVVIVGSDAYRNDNQFFRLPAKYEGLEKMVKLEEGSDEKLTQELKVGHGDIGLGRYATSKLLQTMVAQEVRFLPFCPRLLISFFLSTAHLPTSPYYRH
jgi:NAD(P)-dependent dehydrogenase (short-subunit alcohol dehydrogenase family)